MLGTGGTVFPREEHFQYQIVSPENIHTSNIMQTKQAILRNIYV